MEYKKSMIILTGERGKCAATVETTANGALCRLSVKSEAGERLYLAVKDKPKKFVTPLAGVVKLPFEPGRNAHYAVISSRGNNVVLYGTLSPEKLWAANMVDGVMSEVENFEKKFEAVDAPSLAAKIKTEKIKSEAAYDDEAIAAVDYYPSEYRRMNTKYADFGTFNKRNSMRQSTLADLIKAHLANYNAELKGEKTQKNDNGECGIFALQRKWVLEKDKVNILQTPRRLGGHVGATSRNKSGFVNEKQHEKSERLARFTPETQDDREREEKSAVKIETQKSKTVTFAKNSVELPKVNADFYDTIKPKLDKLFERGERYEKLEKEMPVTKWVKIAYEKSGYYVVGIIGDKPDFICYGVPGSYSLEPPEELGKNCKWLPFDVSKPQEQGLWLLYQDARTGKSVQNPQ